MTVVLVAEDTGTTGVVLEAGTVEEETIVEVMVETYGGHGTTLVTVTGTVTVEMRLPLVWVVTVLVVKEVVWLEIVVNEVTTDVTTDVLGPLVLVFEHPPEQLVMVFVKVV